MGRRFFTWWIVLVPAIVVGLAAPLQGQGDPPIAPGDALAITVFGEPTLTGKYTVGSDGTFEFPLIGRVLAVGLTARGLVTKLTGRLGDGYLKNPQVTVSLERLANVQVFVMGEVRSPGAYQFTNGVTLLEALARAGSANPGAQEALIVRSSDASGDGSSLPAADDGRETLRVDLREGALARNNVKLRNGDTVFVPRAQLVYITGHVRSPGAYSVQPGMTVLQALSLAGGATDRGATNRVRIIRVVNVETDHAEDGKKVGSDEPEEIRVELTDLVQPGDTIVVPERFF